MNSTSAKVTENALIFRPSHGNELLARDKANLDIFWLRDESLEESANLPEPDVLVREIAEEL